MSLTWSLAIATRDRTEYLVTCVECALKQTVKPIDIVVVESGSNYIETKNILNNILAETMVDFKFEHSKIQSTTIQRNRASELSSGDIIFLLDDDSYMDNNCAERILKVYEEDQLGIVGGVMPLLYDNNFLREHQKIENIEKIERISTTFIKKLRTFLKGEIIAPWIAPARSENLLSNFETSVGFVNALHGCRMTFRKNVLDNFKFDEYIKHIHVETELCARINQEYALIQLNEMHIFHDEAVKHPIGRKSSTYRARWILGQTYINLKLSTNRNKAISYTKRYARRTILLDFFIGLRKLNFSRFKGSLTGAHKATDLFCYHGSKLSEKYKEKYDEC